MGSNSGLYNELDFCLDALGQTWVTYSKLQGKQESDLPYPEHSLAETTESILTTLCEDGTA